MAMVVISSHWPAMPQQETDGKIHTADDNEEEKELGKLKIHVLKKYSTVFSYTIDEKPIAGTPMKIHLRDDIQITPQKCYVARATPVNQQAAATKLEQELEAAGIIQKVDKLCHQRQREREEDHRRHSLLGNHHAGTHDKA
jgi:hypothetical protein